MRKIVGGILCFVCLLASTQAQAQEEKPAQTQESDQKASSFGRSNSSKVEIHPDGVVVEATSLYRPKPKKSSGDSSCNDNGDKWQLAIADDRAEGVKVFDSNSLNSTDEQFSVYLASQGSTARTASTGNFLEGAVMNPENRTPTYSKTGRWWKCGLGRVLYPENGVVDINALVLQAIDEAKPGPPTFEISPDKDSLFVQTVHMNAIDETYWQTYSATASAGNVTVTATMNPVQSRWDSGEPNKNPVLCNGPGKLYNGEKATKANYPCSTFYNWSTVGSDPYTMTSTVVFEVSATSSIGPLGPFPSIAISSTEEVRVKEIQAVVVPN